MSRRSPAAKRSNWPWPPERIVIDPVTRIEGHLRIEVEAADGKIAKAWTPCTQFRGMEIVLKDRDPRDAWVFAQRICGVCTSIHALAAIYAVEDALQYPIPPQAKAIRDLISLAQMVQDHVIHFYHLQALDWVNVVSASQADPAKAAALGASLSDWPLNGVGAMTQVQGASHTPARQRPAQHLHQRLLGRILTTACRPRPTCWHWRTTCRRWTGSAR